MSDSRSSRDRTGDEWVLLSYRLPRVPSTPRSAVWRTLKRLGVAQLGDGLVALPADARTHEALEWVAEDVVDHGGEATVWLGRPADRTGRDAITAKMTAAVADEYDAVIAEATTAAADTASARRAAARLTRELRRIGDRDFFPPPQRETAHEVVANLARQAAANDGGDATARGRAATMHR